ncbi:MAG TPA: DUF4167 domain-containing protein [Alphaproteobacteria bacterium]|nr:DUF4167 domain-containing protein [Alphaproteobacteria bacterium]
MKRQRGRNNGRKPHIPVRSQTFDSSGPDVRIRGNAYQVLEKYLAMARDATAAGDRVAAENFYQHAEHYYRMINANAENQMRGPMHGHGGHQQQQHGHGGGHPGHGYQQPQHQHGQDPRAGGLTEQPQPDPGAGPQPLVNGPPGSGTGSGSGGDGKTN